MKINNFQGELTDISAKKEALDLTDISATKDSPLIQQLTLPLRHGG